MIGPSLMQSLEHIQFSTETGCALAAAGPTAAAGRVELPKLQNDKKVFSEAQSRLRSEIVVAPIETCEPKVRKICQVALATD